MLWLLLPSLAFGIVELRPYTEVERVAPSLDDGVPLAQEVLLRFRVGGGPPYEQELWVSAGGERVPARVTWWEEPWSTRVNARVEPALGEADARFVVHWGEQSVGPFEWSPEEVDPGVLVRESPVYVPSQPGCPGQDQAVLLGLKPGDWSYVEAEIETGGEQPIRKTVYPEDWALPLDGDERSERVVRIRLRQVSATGLRSPWHPLRPLHLNVQASDLTGPGKEHPDWSAPREIWLGRVGEHLEWGFFGLIPLLFFGASASFCLGAFAGDRRMKRPSPTRWSQRRRAPAPK